MSYGKQQNPFAGLHFSWLTNKWPFSDICIGSEVQMYVILVILCVISATYCDKKINVQREVTLKYFPQDGNIPG